MQIGYALSMTMRREMAWRTVQGHEMTCAAAEQQDRQPDTVMVRSAQARRGILRGIAIDWRWGDAVWRRASERRATFCRPLAAPPSSTKRKKRATINCGRRQDECVYKETRVTTRDERCSSPGLWLYCSVVVVAAFIIGIEWFNMS